MPTCELRKCSLCGYVFYATTTDCLAPPHGSPSPGGESQGCPGSGLPGVPIAQEPRTEWKNTD